MFDFTAIFSKQHHVYRKLSINKINTVDALKKMLI